MIIKGPPCLDLIQNHINLRVYAMIHTGTMNNAKARNIPTIALKPINEAGGYTLMSLLSGKKIRAIKWAQQVIPDEVIVQVESIVYHEYIP